MAALGSAALICALATAVYACGGALRVVYSGQVPDPFRDGREIIVSGQMVGGRFLAKRDSLITKCPSKFTNTPTGQTN